MQKRESVVRKEKVNVEKNQKKPLLFFFLLNLALAFLASSAPSRCPLLHSEVPRERIHALLPPCEKKAVRA